MLSAKKSNRIRIGIVTLLSLFLARIILALFIIVAFSGCTRGSGRELGENEIRFYQSANSSAGMRWKCSLSNESVLRQKEYYQTNAMLGPGVKQNWIFEIVGTGEVIIFWQQYSGLDFEEDSYSVTYSFAEDGTYEMFSFLDGEISSCSYDDKRGTIKQKHKDFHVYFWEGYVFFGLLLRTKKSIRLFWLIRIPVRNTRSMRELRA